MGSQQGGDLETRLASTTVDWELPGKNSGRKGCNAIQSVKSKCQKRR